MIKNNKSAAAYVAPVCETFEAIPGGVLCGSFFSNDQIPSGTEDDWGVFGARDNSRGIFD